MDLVSRLHDLVRTERKITAEIVDVIRQIESKRIYLSYNCTTMRAFLIKEYGYSGTAAQRRIDAARIARDVPSVTKDLRSGELCLSQLTVLVQAIRQKQKESPDKKVSQSLKQEIVEQLKSKTLWQTQETISKKLDLKLKMHDKKYVQKDESVRLEGTFSKEQYEELERVKELISHQNLNPTLGELFGLLAKFYLDAKDPLRQEVRVGKSKVAAEEEAKMGAKPVQNNGEIQIKSQSCEIADSIESDMTEAVTARHQVTENTNDIKSAQNKGEEIRLEKRGLNKERLNEVCLKKRGLNRSKASNDNQKAKPTNYIPEQTKIQVFQRDRCCQWLYKSTSEEGETTTIKCGSKFQLQIDHKKPKWQDGGNELENLQLLCSTHNKLKYKYEITGKIKT